MANAGLARPRRGGRRGIAALEFGLLAPIFMLSLAGMVDIGNAVVANFVLNASVNAAASFALVNSGQASTANEPVLARNMAAVAANSRSAGWADSVVTVNNGAKATVTAGTAGSSGTASASGTCYCPSGTASSITWGSPVTCGTACASGSVAGKFVVVTASHQFTPLFSQYGFVPGGKVRAAALVQVQ